MSDEADVEDDDDSTTTSTKARWKATGTLASLMLFATTCSVVLLATHRGDPLPLWASTAFVLEALAAAAWTFGESALKAATSAKGGGK